MDMLIPELAIELTRIRIQHANERASLVSQLGNLPAPPALFSFRRRVTPLSGAIELRPQSAGTARRSAHRDRQRIARRLEEMRPAGRRIHLRH